MRSRFAWYCSAGHTWRHDSLYDDSCPLDPHRPVKCPECGSEALAGPFMDEDQAAYVHEMRAS